MTLTSCNQLPPSAVSTADTTASVLPIPVSQSLENEMAETEESVVATEAQALAVGEVVIT